MMAVLFTEGEAGEKLLCPICKMECEEWYSLEPEDDAEWEKLEEKLGDIANWLVCLGCIGTAKEMLGCEIRLVTAEEAAKLADKQFPEIIPERVAKYTEAINEEKCPFCKQPVEVGFEYLTGKKNGEIFRSFRSITISCSSCGSVVKETAPCLDKPLGYFVTGTILDFNNRLLLVEVISPAPPLEPRNVRIQDGKTILMLEHKCDLLVLGTFKTEGELVEILVMGNRAIRVKG